MLDKTLGIRHIALRVKNIQECKYFYHEILQMEIDWEPDSNNIYLTNGHDNLALHYSEEVSNKNNTNTLDHFGIVVRQKSDVDLWYNHITNNKVSIHQEIKDHRDGSRSFYCNDPDQNIVQIIWIPKISDK